VELRNDSRHSCPDDGLVERSQQQREQHACKRADEFGSG
jgi:hypothetical protein